MSTFALVYSDVPGFPAGTAVEGVVVAVSDAAATPPVALSQKVAPGTASVDFPGLAAGDYAYTVTNVDASGATLGSVVSGTFSIAAPATVTISLVTGATVTP